MDSSAVSPGCLFGYLCRAPIQHPAHTSPAGVHSCPSASLTNAHDYIHLFYTYFNLPYFYFNLSYTFSYSCLISYSYTYTFYCYSYSNSPTYFLRGDVIDINDYQRFTKRTALYPDSGRRTPNAINYTILGLIGEAGELANDWKKAIRGDLDPAVIKEKLRWELGDVLWYVARAADELGMSLDDVANANLDKLKDRGERKVIKGSGDTR